MCGRYSVPYDVACLTLIGQKERVCKEKEGVSIPLVTATESGLKLGLWIDMMLDSLPAIRAEAGRACSGRGDTEARKRKPMMHHITPPRCLWNMLWGPDSEDGFDRE